MTKPFINEHHKGMLRQWLANPDVLRSFMRRWPGPEAPQSKLDGSTFKFVSYATGLDYRQDALVELMEFLREEGHLWYDGTTFYSLVPR